METEPSDEEIIAQACVHKEFFGILVARYESRLFRYVHRLGVKNEDDVLDILQDVFIKAYKNMYSFDTNLSFSSWMYRITHNETMSWYRKRHVRPEGHLVEDGETILSFIENSEWENEARFDTGINAQKINTALRALDPKYRDVVILRFFEYKEYEEISDILKIPISSVGTLLHRAKKQLKDLLDQETLRI